MSPREEARERPLAVAAGEAAGAAVRRGASRIGRTAQPIVRALKVGRHRAESSLAIRSRTRYCEEVLRDERLESRQIDSSEFHECEFASSVLTGSEFRACRFVECTFWQCDLSLVGLPHTTFSACRFEDSKLVGINWTEASWPETRLWVPVGFARCVVSHSTFMGLNLAGVRFSDCVAQDVDFRDSDLSRADFGGTDLSKSLFVNTDLTEADLSSARNYRIDPRENTIVNAKFSLPEAISLLDGLGVELTGWEP